MRAFLVVSLIALFAGVVLIVAYAVVGGWSLYPLVTPLLLAGGSAGVLYGMRLPGAPAFLTPDRRRGERPAPRGAGVRPGRDHRLPVLGHRDHRRVDRHGNGMRTARNLNELAPVILDTQDRLFLTDGIVKETALPAQEDARFKFRYRGLRLLIHGDGKLFLVPEKWSPSDSTLLVPLDDSVRVQFRFVNRAP